MTYKLHKLLACRLFQKTAYCKGLVQIVSTKRYCTKLLKKLQMIANPYRSLCHQPSLILKGVVNMSITPGLIPPELSLSATSKQTITADSLRDKFTILYFYPKDSSPGCTTEGLDFSALDAEFTALNAQIFGVSLDSLARHEAFKSKQNFPFELISDPDATLCRLFEVYQLKKNFGKEYMGIVRSTFLINPQGHIDQAWRNVKVAGHAQAVLEALKHRTKSV
jgi:peroxiredoxin Q/BCP